MGPELGDGRLMVIPMSTMLSAACRFAGKERDTESGNDYFGARYYSSTMGRSLSPDPGWFFSANMFDPQSLNLYSHALNNPLVWLDTDGLELVRAVLSNGQSVVVDRSIAADVMGLVDDAQAAGLRVTITSGFRSVAEQRRRVAPVSIVRPGIDIRLKSACMTLSAVCASTDGRQLKLPIDDKQNSRSNDN